MKFVGWSVAALIGCIVLFYLVAVAINWRDQPPSDIAIAFERAYRDRQPIADADNAFPFVLGFGVAPGDDVRRVGLERIEWMRQQRGRQVWDLTLDPLHDPYDYEKARPQKAREFLQACATVGEQCENAVARAEEVYDEWRASELWLLERYERLIDHAGWQEIVPDDIAAPLPAYKPVMDGQKLFLVKAAVAAAGGKGDEARALLARDIRFWRTVLAESDILITKMIAVAALRRHFELGNTLLRGMSMQHEAPAEWYQPLSRRELSMRRTIAGEWIFASKFYLEGARDASSETFAPIGTRLAAPLYQPQDTLNKEAQYYADTIHMLDVPIERYKSAVGQVRQFKVDRERRLSTFHVYNPLGTWLLSIGGADFGNYAARVTDLEGVRRAAVLATSLRAKGVKRSDVPDAIATSVLRNPYDQGALEWEADEGFIVFRGLEKSERSVYRIRY